MADFKAFYSLRPTAEKASLVAALPYDVVNRKEAKAIGDENPDSFLHVDRAEMDLAPETDLYAPVVYQKARENLDRLEENGILVQDRTPGYYLYELTRLGKVQTGIVGCSAIDDYLEGTIKKHELTREDKEQDRIRHVDVCDANTGPIYLAAEFPADLKKWSQDWKEDHEAYCDFLTEDSVRQRVWVVDEPEAVSFVQKQFAGMPSLYIADGHHRAASAVKVGLKRREEYPDHTGQEEFNYFLTVVFPYDELTILAYNRVVSDLNGNTPKDFLKKLTECFAVCEADSACQPVEKHSIGMYMAGEWYELKVRPEVYDGLDVVGQLDVSILQERVLSPLLGIGDPRTDQRISFVGGSHGLDELAALADKTGGVSFAMFPTSMEDLMKIADEGKLMPPKSTWFEPKLRSGLFIHKLR